MNSKRWKVIFLLITAGILIYAGINSDQARDAQRVTDGNEAKVRERYESSLPVVYIDTENRAPIDSKETYIKAAMEIQGNALFPASDQKLYTGTVEIKGRGNTSWDLAPKKSYKLKIAKSTDIFGFGKSKHWVLLANYTDSSLMRNKVVYDLSGKLGMPHMESTWVDVVLNGTYIGNYQFCE